MALTLAQLVDHVEHVAKGDPDARIDPVDVINEAGEYLVSMHPWSWLDRPALDLQFVANQNYVDLPSDFDQLVAVEAGSRLENTVHQTTLQDIQRLRSSALVDPFMYHVAVEYPPRNSVSDGQPPARLAIWPTPGTTETGGLTVNYRAGWLRLTDMDEAANIPPGYDRLLISIVRAITHGYVNEDQGTVEQRIEPIERSTMLRRLKEDDGLAQGHLGATMGGVTQDEYSFIYRPYKTIRAGGQ